jgi:Lysophospholipase
MKTAIALLLCCVPFVSSYCQDIAGSWTGKLALPTGGKLTIVFHISRTDGGYSTLLDSPDQGAKGIATASTTFENNVVKISVPRLNASYKGELTVANKLQGTFTQGIALPLTLERGDITKAKRPQEPQPPFPYKTEEVKFRNENAGISLAGTLTLPATGSKHPVVVLVTGSGAQNRDEELMGHKPFWVIADFLTREGFAVLRYDDRGVGGSEGTPEDATTSDFATDTEAALNYLKTRDEIDPAKTGIIGHSEGGMIAFMLAAKHKDIAFIVSMAGPGFKIQELMLKQAEMTMKAQSASGHLAWMQQKPVLRDRYALLTQDMPIDDLKKKLYDDVMKTIPANLRDDENTKKQINDEIAVMTSPWYIAFMKYDPVHDLEKIKCPVFAINGEKDTQVHAETSLAAIGKAIRSNGNQHVRTKSYPGLNHLFQHCKTGSVSEYGDIEETISPEVLNDIKDWLKQRSTQ